ncbi:MAG: hypothetical protein A2788_00640 [Candidatus Abawacabacteria bacterium RIFCSPHIGHO2_01_FULL_46_8]|uniref:Antitoxin n=1 Tax=Candidatus Abawacabacteria bacterium RIFCSPHIGHO2_01_FULL_46_8 TaxID=1817815 RepID=A0A1F4XK87_9BACT|nr:MAG: hypothetical protein A2788_00640 [Candidatus Abawacabacteria bacterium RIFCSPHIGHO2_01_FULL_46_8]
MSHKNTLSISEARKRIFEIAKQVQHPNIIYTITEKGSPKVVMMSADEFESWLETLEVFKDFPDLEKDIAKHKQAIKSGKYKKYQLLDSLD